MIDLSMEARLTIIEKEMNNSMGDMYKWDQINMNVSTPPTDNIVQLDELHKTRNGPVSDDFNSKQGFRNNNMDHLQNGNQQVCDSSLTMRAEASAVHASSAGMAASSDMSLSRSTEELSPEKHCHPPQVMKSHSISNIETGGLTLFSFDGESDQYDAPAVSRILVAGTGAQGQSIVRSKSASLLNDQTLQVYPSSSASSSDRSVVFIQTFCHHQQVPIVFQHGHGCPSPSIQCAVHKQCHAKRQLMGSEDT